MSYTPTNWKTGDKVTAEKLNNIEDGIVNNALPSVTPEDNGKVLGVENGAWTVTDSESSGTEEWKALSENIGFVYFEATSDNAADISVYLRNGHLFANVTWFYDVETGDYLIEYTHEWSSEDIADITSYIPFAQQAIEDALMLARFMAQVNQSDSLAYYLPGTPMLVPMASAL